MPVTRTDSDSDSEKPHSMMTHWADSDNLNYETVGRIRIISTCVTESRMKTHLESPESLDRVYDCHIHVI